MLEVAAVGSKSVFVVVVCMRGRRSQIGESSEIEVAGQVKQASLLPQQPTTKPSTAKSSRTIPSTNNPVPSNHNPPAKKRKTNSQPIPIHPQPAQHLNQNPGESDLSSYISDQATHHPPATKPRTIRIHKPVNPKNNNNNTSKTPSQTTNLVPLTDAELLSAAAGGSHYSQQDSSSGFPNKSNAYLTPHQHPPSNTKTKKKNQANSQGPKKRSIPSNPSASTAAPISTQPAPTNNITSNQPAATKTVGTKPKTKKGQVPS
ncbi:hypothetical protein VP01_2638g3 [Puccinia sorghi]|uniref:Uncharacterized protein n=1 Tax=Puccinia sorghi TaxID=27349 RepID=A0A0L6V4D7_9BASI|nr:hypothetical protein VP01_2638g3 [Puccinia sorghi]